MTILRLTLALAVVIAAPLQAQLRTYAGPFSTNWKTIGPHGHDQPMCAEPNVTVFPNGAILMTGVDCNPIDFARGNLDNSIGFRSGVERDFFAKGPFAIVGGVEGSLSETEYNLSQADFILATGSAFAGADVHIGHFSVGARYGAGPFATSDRNEFGLQRFYGAELTIPLRAGAALRVSQRSMRVLDFSNRAPGQLGREPKSLETSVLIVASPEYRGSTLWEFAAATGSTMPGFGAIGGDRKLRSSTYSLVTAYRDLPWHNLQARVSWSASAHESIVPTTFRGYDGNFRSKTIDGYALGVSRAHRLNDHFSIRYGGGMEVADWRDEHGLLARDNQKIVGGIETAMSADAGLRWHLGRNLALEASMEQLYWQRLDLGEVRAGFSLVVTK